MNLLEIRKEINETLIEYKTADSQLKKEQKNIKEVEKRLANTEQAQEITQHVAQLIQQQAHQKIERVVSKCLQAVFGTLYGFKIVFERKRGRTEAKLLLLKDGHEIEGALDADSGGVIDVAALALRLACIVLTKPALERILVLDEPFKNLDAVKRVHVGQLIKRLAAEYGVQFIMVTHIKEFEIGKVVKI